MSHSIRINVADLAAYNAGHLHGAWIDATAELEDIHDQIKAILASSPVEGAEEYAIHDHEGFDGYSLGEYEGIEAAHELALLSSQTSRSDIAAGVEMQRYFQPEEEIAFLGPSPARTLIQVLESVTLAELGAFFSRHSNKGRNEKFDVRGAFEEFQRKRAAFEPLEDATDAAYQELAKGLGQEWSDHLNRTWDRLGHAVCEIILSRRPLLLQMPDDCRQQLVELARLGNLFAQKCVEALGMNVPSPYPDAAARRRVLFTLSGVKKAS